MLPIVPSADGNGGGGSSLQRLITGRKISSRPPEHGGWRRLPSSWRTAEEGILPKQPHMRAIQQKTGFI